MSLLKHHREFSHIGTEDIGVVVIHGFTSTTSSMLYVAEKFAEKGYHVEMPPLSGHGTEWVDLEKTPWMSWIEDVEKAIDTCYKRTKNVYLVGLSMGGTIAMKCLERYPKVKGASLINHAFVFTNPMMKWVPILKGFKRTTKAIASDIKDPSMKEIAYDKTPLEGIDQMLKLIKSVRMDWHKLTQPVIIFKSKDDHVIPIVSAEWTYNNLNSMTKKLVWLDNSYHVATLDYDKDIIIESSDEFFKMNLENE
ncbi:MAG: alpha/beta fold hydrolase [Candidatus Cloacimonetes bacterium]|nr:alpha/beta fold hydrolase [Candidatus Cloacimonadota bacterium]